MKQILEKIKKFIFSIDNNYYIIMGISIILIMPLVSYFYVNGHDTNFHLSNTTILNDYFKNGSFNIFYLKILPFSARGFGYGIGIFYPRLAHSLMAYLSFFTNNIITGAKIFQFCVTSLSAIFMYKLINRYSHNKTSALIGSIFYMCAPYFLSEFYVRGAFAESLNFIFTPMIFIGIYDLLYNNKKMSFYLYFIIGFVGVVNSHLITGMFLVFFILVFLLFNIKKVLKKDKIFAFVLASLIILIFISPFLVLMMQHKLFGNYGVFLKDYMGNPSWAYGTALNLSDYFSINSNVEDHGISFYLNIIMFVMFLYSIINYKNIVKKTGNKLFFLSISVLTIISFVLSTKLIHWYKFPDFLLLIQFPWRLEIFTNFFMSIIASLLVVNWNATKVALYKPIIIISTIFIALSSIDYVNINYLKELDISNDSMGSIKEYLPVNTLNNIDYYNERSQDIIVVDGEADIKMDYSFASDLNAKIDLNSDNVILELPRLYYFGYDLQLQTDEKLMKLDYKENEYGFITVKIEESGTLSVNYTGTKLYRLTNLIKTICSIFIVAFFIAKLSKIWRSKH